MFAATVWVVTQITTTSTVTIQLQNENFTSNLTISYQPAYTLWRFHSEHQVNTKKLHQRVKKTQCSGTLSWQHRFGGGVVIFLPFVKRMLGIKRIFPCSFGNNRMHVYTVLPLKCMDWGTWVLVIATQMDNSGTFSVSGILVLIVLLETLEHTLKVCYYVWNVHHGMQPCREVSVNKWIVTTTCYCLL